MTYGRKMAVLSATLLCIHGLIEIMMPLFLVLFSIDPSNIGVDVFQTGGAALIGGAVWGSIRITTAWGIALMKRWAVVLGILMSTITMTASMNILPAGLLDLAFSAPVLVLLLYLVFENASLSVGD